MWHSSSLAMFQKHERVSWRSDLTDMNTYHHETRANAKCELVWVRFPAVTSSAKLQLYLYILTCVNSYWKLWLTSERHDESKIACHKLVWLHWHKYPNQMNLFKRFEILIWKVLWFVFISEDTRCERRHIKCRDVQINIRRHSAISEFMYIYLIYE